MEDGFMMTPTGMQNYAAHIQQIANGTVLLGILDVVFTLLQRAANVGNIWNTTGRAYSEQVCPKQRVHKR